MEQVVGGSPQIAPLQMLAYAAACTDPAASGRRGADHVAA